ncbi:TetR/AcrR family transcriptional regulator [Solimonas flava]|uniref:TetR/AcrR family transcriptional regulator n=1 Tax=Solimonas flava TaxID=415849 RepID=UPI000409CD32|nr:TetR/AcrR family transcriptional regulator [Solimonas flava]
MSSTAPRTRRSRRAWTPMSAEERHRRLIEAAIRVIARDGLPAASTRAVAAEAGMNQAMLHYTYTGKDELLIAVLEAIHADVRRVIGAAVQGAATLADAARQVSRAYWQHVVADPALQKVHYELTLYALTASGQTGLARRQYEGYIEMLAQAFASVAPTWPQDELRRLAGAALAAMDGLILQFLATGDTAACEARLQWIDAAIDAAARRAPATPAAAGRGAQQRAARPPRSR